MHKFVKPVVIGAVAAVGLCGLIVAAGSMASVAVADTPAEQLVTSAGHVLFPEPQKRQVTYVRFSDQQYSVSAADGYSLDAISTATVRKIGYGRSQMVTISTTSSGVYSSDGLASPNFRYPGLEVSRVPSGAELAAAGSAIPDTLARWSARHGWVATPTVSANSFMIVTRDGDHTIFNGTAGHCVIGPSIAIC